MPARETNVGVNPVVQMATQHLFTRVCVCVRWFNLVFTNCIALLLSHVEICVSIQNTIQKVLTSF